MFFFRRPTAQRIDRFRQMATRETFSYPEVGATLKGEIPERYNLDRNRVRLGEGAVTFERASAALCEWKMFDIGWVELLHPREPCRLPDRRCSCWHAPVASTRLAPAG